MAINEITIEMASVKVMRSHDYCHFEVALSTASLDPGDRDNTLRQADDLRKEAARLVDKAVEQYKVSKINAHKLEYDATHLEHLRFRYSDILKKPEGERTPEEMAIVKTISDRAHRNRRRYNYEDDWSEPDYDDSDDSY